MTGQDAFNTAKAFNDRLNFDGVVLTNWMAIRAVERPYRSAGVEKPIKFMSLGEKMEAIDRFYPDRMASRILGMGDVGLTC
jgi:signal recognition particle subunit SRP54